MKRRSLSLGVAAVVLATSVLAPGAACALEHYRTSGTIANADVWGASPSGSSVVVGLRLWDGSSLIADPPGPGAKFLSFSYMEFLWSPEGFRELKRVYVVVDPCDFVIDKGLESASVHVSTPALITTWPLGGVPSVEEVTLDIDGAWTAFGTPNRTRQRYSWRTAEGNVQTDMRGVDRPAVASVTVTYGDGEMLFSGEIDGNLSTYRDMVTDPNMP